MKQSIIDAAGQLKDAALVSASGSPEQASENYENAAGKLAEAAAFAKNQESLTQQEAQTIIAACDSIEAMANET